MRQVMLTTIDNPFNPFVDFDNWFLFDIEKDYYTLSKLARLSKVDLDVGPIESRTPFVSDIHYP